MNSVHAPTNLAPGHSVLSLRTKSFVRLWDIPAEPVEFTEEPLIKAEVIGDIVSSVWAPDGSALGINIQDQGLVLYAVNKSCSGAPSGQPSSDGPSLGEIASSSLCKYMLPLPEGLKDLPSKQLKWIAFSPKGTYLSTFWATSGPGIDLDLAGVPNYLIWKLHRDENNVIVRATIVISEFHQRLSHPGRVQWRDDEEFRINSSDGKVQVFDGHDFEKPPICSSPVSVCFQVSIAPRNREWSTDHVTVTMFASANQSTGSPGEIRILFLDVSRLAAHGGIVARIAVKELSDVDGCDFLWSPSGRRCIMLSSTLVDAAGENYGSIGDLWLCDLNDNLGDEASNVPASQEISHERLIAIKENMSLANGSVCHSKMTKINKRVTQDAKWSPVNEEFVMIEGKSPCDIFLVDGKTGVKIHKFSQGYRNMICWSPFGDMIAIGGFGNMAGDLTFYYRAPDTNAISIIAELREPCTVLYNWSPCGRYFFTASVKPRMNVDNVITIWSREGAKLFHMPFDDLYDVAWKSADRSAFAAPSVPLPKAGGAAARASYRPRNWQQSTADTQILARYLEGEITEKELPEHLRRRARRGGDSNNGAGAANRNNRFAPVALKEADFALDWRSGPSEPMSEVPAPQQLQQESNNTSESGGGKGGNKLTVTPSPSAIPSHNALDGSSDAGAAKRPAHQDNKFRINDHNPPPPNTEDDLGVKTQQKAHKQQSSRQPSPLLPQPLPVRPEPTPHVEVNTELPPSTTPPLPAPEAKVVFHPPTIQNPKRIQQVLPMTFEPAAAAPPPPSLTHSPPSYPPSATAGAANFFSIRDSPPPRPQGLCPVGLCPESMAGESDLLSLLQSILPSHAKVHVEPVPDMVATGSAASRPQRRSPPPIASSGFHMSSPVSNQGPPPSFPRALPKRGLTAQEEEAEHEHFIRLFRQAGVVLPNVTPASAAVDTNQRSSSSRFTPGREQQQVMVMNKDPALSPGGEGGAPRPTSQLHSHHPHQQQHHPQPFPRQYHQMPPQPMASGMSPHATAASLNDSVQELLWQLRSSEMGNRSSGVNPRSGGHRRSEEGTSGIVSDRHVFTARPDLSSQREEAYRFQNPPPTEYAGRQQQEPPRTTRATPSESSVTTASRKWQYVDPKGKIQGPFTQREMRAWWDMGYFSKGLPVRCDPGAGFKPLKEMFPDGVAIFPREM